MSDLRLTFGRRWYAFLWSRLGAGVDRLASELKDAVLVDMPHTIVEVGAGRGANFRRYPTGGLVIAFEPNRHMHDSLRRAASDLGLDLDLRGTGAESLDLPDGSQEVVVSTHTLCSVADPTRAISEIRRVLRSGGRFLFIEHIAGEPGSRLAGQQRLMRVPWGLVGDRCDLLAETHHLIERAGFARVDLSIAMLGSRLDPSRRVVFGSAVR